MLMAQFFFLLLVASWLEIRRYGLYNSLCVGLKLYNQEWCYGAMVLWCLICYVLELEHLDQVNDRTRFNCGADDFFFIFFYWQNAEYNVVRTRDMMVVERVLSKHLSIVIRLDFVRLTQISCVSFVEIPVKAKIDKCSL